MRNNFASKWKQQWSPKRRQYMGKSEVSTSVVKSIIVRRYTDQMKFVAYMALSFITCLSYSSDSILYHFMVVRFVCFCLIFKIMYSYWHVFFYVYVFLLLRMFCSGYTVTLCCSVYCLCKCVLHYCHWAFIIIRRYTDQMKFVAYMVVSSITCLSYSSGSILYHFMVVRFVCFCLIL